MFAAFNLYGDVSAMPISDTPYPDFERDVYGPENSVQVNRMADHTQAGGNANDSPDFASPEAADAESGTPCPLEADDPNSAPPQGAAEENENIFPLQADEKLEIPKNVKDAIQSYLLKAYQVKSVDFIVCNQMMQNGEVLKDRLQFTAYAADAGTLESDAQDIDDQAADQDNNEIDAEREVDTEMEQPAVPGAFFVFQTPGKTPEEPLEFLYGYVCN